MDIFQVNRIFTEIKHRVVKLRSSNDILRFCFIAQHSLSPLDLAQQDGYIRFSRDRRFSGFEMSSILGRTTPYPKYFINTEEKCRLILSTTRDFLYRFHLDMPKNREISLKDGPEPDEMTTCSTRRHIGKITVESDFHFAVLSSFVKKAIKSGGNKLKMVTWLFTFDAVAENAMLNRQNALYFAKCIFSMVPESAIVQAFLKKMDLWLWLSHNDRPDILEFLLYYMRQTGVAFVRCNPIDVCVTMETFLHIGPLLKYQDAPRLPERKNVWLDYYRYIQGIGPSYPVLLEAEKWMGPKRFYLMLQLLHVYFVCPTAAAAECLHLLWRSLPDPFFSFEEIETALKEGLSSEKLTDLYNFYSRAVGEYHAYVEPRSLKHLCRSTIRRMLWENGYWIPDGIKLTNLPIKLQAFLNLEA